MQYFELTDQVAIVTGGAQGLGEAIARRLSEAGARVVIADIQAPGAEKLASQLPGAIAIATDISKPESVAAATAAVLGKLGKIDILINNAGIAGRSAPIWEQTPADWEAAMSVNIAGVVNFMRAVLPHMRERQYGRIVSLASVAGKEGNPNMSAYSASKAAVIALTKSVAKEVATENICVNCVAPAVVQTRILDQLTPEQIKYMTDKIPMRRTGRPEEIAAVVHFLSSPDCSFVTGQCYDASGGRCTY